MVGEWVKACRQTGEPSVLYYWQLSTGDEVDLIIDRGGILYGLEIKATATPTPRRGAGALADARRSGSSWSSSLSGGEVTDASPGNQGHFLASSLVSGQNLF